jgi:3-phosphoshikimate 1-carboxyvinyltransferase
MAAMPDLVPTLAVLAAFAQGETLITGAAHLRHKDSDRLAAMAAELGKMGINRPGNP